MRHTRLLTGTLIFTLTLAALPVKSADAAKPAPTVVQQLPNFKKTNFAAELNNQIQQFNTKLATILQQPPSWDNTLQPVIIELDQITRSWNLLAQLNSVQSNATLQADYQQMLPVVYAFYAQLMQNTQLHAALKTIANSADFNKLTPMQQTAVKQYLLNLQLNGAGLASDDLKRYQQIIQRLSVLAQKFNSNLQNATQSWEYFVPSSQQDKLAGLPQYVRDTAAAKAQAQNKDGWILTLDDNCLVAVTSYAKDRQLRQDFVTAYSTLASDQDPDPARRQWDNNSIIYETLTLRSQLATLLGYKNYAAYVSADNNRLNPSQTLKMLDNLANSVKTAAQNEYAAIQKFALNTDQIDQLQPWDVVYYAEWLKFSRYNQPQEKSRQYLSVPNVLIGLFNLSSILFDIQIQEITPSNAWDEQVKLYLIKDNNNIDLGYFYLDLFRRPAKQAGEWTNFYSSRLQSKDQQQLPVAFINTNFANPNLTLNETVILFREFGKMLAHNLTRFEYPSLAGNLDDAWYAMQISGNLLQLWPWQPMVLQDIAQNSSNTKVPTELFDQLLGAKNFNAGIMLLQQCILSMLDLEINMQPQNDQAKSAQEILAKLQQQYAVVPVIANDQLPDRLGVLFGSPLGGEYFSLLWNQVVAQDVFAAFQENGLFSAKVGHKFSSTFLQNGTTESSVKLFKQFRGREPENKFLLTEYKLN